MEKTIVIDGKEVRLKATAALPLRYKAQFGRDFFADIFKLAPLEKALRSKKIEDLNASDLDGLDMTVFYNLVWVMAKTADKSIPDPIAWLDQFGDFPIDDALSAVLELLEGTMRVKKKWVPPQKRRKN